MDALHLKERLSEAVQLYIEDFPGSYVGFGQTHGATLSAMGRAFDIYAQSVRANADAICDHATIAIGVYLDDYRVTPRGEVDEFKYIYFVGMAIKEVLPPIQPIVGSHLFSMIKMLDYVLDGHGVKKKPHLTNAMMRIIREGKFEQEMGATGCYLVYKCVSTTERMSALVGNNDEVPVKGTGVDRKQKRLGQQLRG